MARMQCFDLPISKKKKKKKKKKKNAQKILLVAKVKIPMQNCANIKSNESFKTLTQKFNT